ncbi:helix-turn-helix domain-containing protein [Hazenella sp. IB182357]|uniref:Helix-turn-helix domain-containing protein n=1 Tax=Polycladospora coralii TaxID=2771432 RepID=A0A926N899_9BACL|nr:helix-turn-helix domain-containing protein [Polycladospora coralii]MBS7530461.1 helix-turn-helix domain-containing protein [Polycladospora coralii]
MDFSKIGHNIRELRKKMNISQADLADGICTQAQISKIENGCVYPLSTTLYMIANKLGVDINYFFDICETPRLDYVTDVIELIRDYLRNREYEKVYNIVKAERNNPLFQTVRNKQFLLWNEGICVFRIHQDKEKALMLMKKALSLTLNSVYSIREMEIINSIGNVYTSTSEYHKAIPYYNQVIEQYKALPVKKNVEIINRVYYNYARCLTFTGKLEDSVYYCDQGIKNCVYYESMHTLGELFYQKGVNLQQLEQIDAAISYLQKATYIFDLQHNMKYVEEVELEIAALLSGKEDTN